MDDSRPRALMSGRLGQITPSCVARSSSVRTIASYARTRRAFEALRREPRWCGESAGSRFKMSNAQCGSHNKSSKYKKDFIL